MTPRRWLPLLTVAASLVAGCAGSTLAVKPCCYAGAVTTARLGALPVTLASGRVVAFGEAFPGFAPQPGLLTASLPFDTVLREDVIYASLRPLLPLYDANGDGRLEKPEVVVLYAREAGLATGTDIRHFGAGPAVRAVSTANADLGGLVAWVRSRRAAMSERGRLIFDDLERLGLDLRTRGSEGGPDGARAILRR